MTVIHTPGALILPSARVAEIPDEWGKDCLGAWEGPINQLPVSAWPQTHRRDDKRIALPDGAFLSIDDARALAVALLTAALCAEKCTVQA